MDRSMAAPLQECTASHRCRRSSRRDLRKLYCLVTLCLSSVFTLALPVAYLLGRSFRDLQPPEQEAAVGRWPTAQRHSSQPAPLPMTAASPNTKIKIHLRAINANLTPCVMNESPILQWEDENQETMSYLSVPKTGDYFVYSHIFFQGCDDDMCRKERENCNSNAPLKDVTHIKQVISKRTKAYPEVTEIMSGISSINKMTLWKETIYLGAIVYLREGEELMVNVSNTNLVHMSESFFGAFLI